MTPTLPTPATTTTTSKERIEPVMYMLCALMLFFTIATFIAEKYFPNDGQLFQVVTNLLSASAGAFFMRTKGGVSTGTTTQSTPPLNGLPIPPSNGNGAPTPPATPTPTAP